MASKGVKEMLDEGLKEVPENYVRPLHERPALYEVCTDVEVPVVDFSNVQEPGQWTAIVSQIGRACEEWGFFLLVNHGVQTEKILKAVKRFYELPTAEKKGNLSAGSADSGVTFSTGTGSTPDWKDSLVIRRRPGICDGFQSAPEILRDEVLEYRASIDKIAGLLNQAIFESVGLTKAYIQEHVPSLERLVLVNNFYPPCPNPSLVFGQSSHSDLNSLTILLPDGVPGLQVKKDDKWVAVQPLPNAFVINVADQIEILTNAKYKSVEHRVVVNKLTPRISLAALFGPREDQKIAPLGILINETNPPIFKEVTFGEYIMNYYTQNLPLYKTTLNYVGGKYSSQTSLSK